MAKKAVIPKSQLVHIKTTSADDALLSKAQKEFNRLSKRVVKLEKELHDFRAEATRVEQRARVEFVPLQKQYMDYRAEMVHYFDEALGTHKLTKPEIKKLTDLIANMSNALINRGYDEFIPVFEKHTKLNVAEEDIAADRAASEMMKVVFSQRYGITFDPNVDVSTQEKFEDYVAQQMALRQDQQQTAAAEQAERRAQRPKTAKQQAAEAKREAAEAKRRAEEKHATKSVRALYMDLVKALHPDREPDEAEKLRKTELLKKVTVAYENNELLTLLRLQLELDRTSQAHLENLAEDQLKHFNKLLREQTRELEDALYDEQMSYSSRSGSPSYLLPTVHSMAYDLKHMIQDVKVLVKSIVEDLKNFRTDPAALKVFLKGYKVKSAADMRRVVFMG